MIEEGKKALSLGAYREYMKNFRCATAPGRIEFLGNHIDYNGGKVLGAAINGVVCADFLSAAPDDLRDLSSARDGLPFREMFRWPHVARKCGAGLEDTPDEPKPS